MSEVGREILRPVKASGMQKAQLTPKNHSGQTDRAVPVGAMLMFSTFVYFGYRNRFQPTVHKRLMWFATMSLLDAGFDRWPVFDPYSLPVVNLICYTPLLMLLIGYDWWSTGNVQRVTIWSTIFMTAVQQIRHPLGHTAAWQSFAAWVAMHMPSFS